VLRVAARVGDEGQPAAEAPAATDRPMVLRLPDFLPRPVEAERGAGNIVFDKAGFHFAKSHFRLLPHQMGQQRLWGTAGVLQELKIFACKAGAYQFVSPAPKTARVEVPDVPGAFVLNDVLTVAECQQFRRAAGVAGYTADKAVPTGGEIDGGGGKYDTEGLAQLEWLVDSSIMEPIWERIGALLPQELGGGRVTGLNARWRFFKYSQGSVYRPHVDGAWPGSGLIDGEYVFDAFQDRWSRLTCLFYLNEDFEGGSTTFYTPSVSTLGVIEARGVKPRTGSVLFFPHGDTAGALVHEGGLVLTGEKSVIRTEVLYSKPPARGVKRGRDE